MLLATPPSPSSILAVVTTAHLALAALRNHRLSGPSGLRVLALISLVLAATPWLFPSAAGLAFGMGLHGFWFLICERVAPPAPAQLPPSAPAPAAKALAEKKPTPPTPPQGFVQTPVLAIFEEASDIRTFRFARPAGFEFVPGQFVAIRVRADGKDHVRCYSISSAPEVRGYLEISVKRQGLVSNTLHGTLRPGAQVSLKSPAGAFRYPSNDDRPVVLIAGGVGITPLLSMLRHAVHAEPTRSVTLLYSAQTEEHLAFRDEIRMLARRHPQVRVFFAASRGVGMSDVYPGRIDDTLLSAAVPDAAHAIAMLCGPQKMIDGMRALLQARGMPPAQVRSEIFEAAVAASANGATAAATAAASTAASAARSGALEIVCQRSKTTLRIAGNQTLLDAAEAAGVGIESLCRAGVCGTCRTRVVSGDMACTSSMLDDADRRSGFVLACVSRPQTNCVIEA